MGQSLQFYLLTMKENISNLVHHNVTDAQMLFQTLHALWPPMPRFCATILLDGDKSHLRSKLPIQHLNESLEPQHLIIDEIRYPHQISKCGASRPNGQGLHLFATNISQPPHGPLQIALLNVHYELDDVIQHYYRTNGVKHGHPNQRDIAHIVGGL